MGVPIIASATGAFDLLGIEVVGLLMVVLLIAAAIAQVFCVFRLTAALRVGEPTLFALGVFVPCLSLILLLLLSQWATKHLQSHGLTVGLLGVNPKSI